MTDWNVLLKLGLAGFALSALCAVWLVTRFFRQLSALWPLWVCCSVLCVVSIVAVLQSQGFSVQVISKYSSGSGAD